MADWACRHRDETTRRAAPERFSPRIVLRRERAVLAFVEQDPARAHELAGDGIDGAGHRRDPFAEQLLELGDHRHHTPFVFRMSSAGLHVILPGQHAIWFDLVAERYHDFRSGTAAVAEIDRRPRSGSTCFLPSSRRRRRSGAYSLRRSRSTASIGSPARRSGLSDAVVGQRGDHLGSRDSGIDAGRFR